MTYRWPLWMLGVLLMAVLLLAVAGGAPGPFRACGL